MSRFLKPVNVLQYIARNKHSHRYEWFNEGIQYHGFKYYPRHPDFKDPPYEPSKLFRVQRIKPLKGVPYYEKEILKQFKLLGLKTTSDVVIIKNIPENNCKLWKIKHLIEIQPISFPDGFPKDINGTFLHENGELSVMKQLPSQELLEMTEKIRTNEKRMDGDSLRRDSRKKWVQGW